jgi:iron complex outermembrane receptor protein
MNSCNGCRATKPANCGAAACATSAEADMHERLKLLAAVTCTLALDALPTLAIAQEAAAENTPANAPLNTIAVSPDEPPQQPTPERSSDGRQIEEVIVTATKRAESVRDIPASITAFNGKSLEDEGQLNLADYIQRTPGLTVNQSYPGLSRFTIRGISTETTPTSPLPTPVGFFIGDTAFTDPYLASIIPDLSAFDLAGVQVLKGPQGTLFGGAALSGAIRYELQDPVQGEWQVRGFAQSSQPYQGSLAMTGGAAVNIPLLPEDNLAMRLTYIRRNYPGVIDEPRSDGKNVDKADGDQYRAILLWEPEDWKLKFTHLSQDFHADNTAGGVVESVDGPRQNDIFVTKTPADNRFDLDSLELGYNFDSMRVVSLSSYVTKDVSETRDATYSLIGKPPAAYPKQLAFTSPVYENSKAFSQELRLQSTGSGPFKWLAGAYFYSYQLDFGLKVVTPETDLVLGQDSALLQLFDQLGLDADPLVDETSLLTAVANVKSTEKALFFDLSYTLWDDLDLSAGARLYDTTVDGGLTGTGLLIRAENDGMAADSRSNLSEKGINPKFAATWRMTAEMSMYAQIAKGFRFGGIQITPSTATNGVPPTYKSDTLWNHELGIRTSWLDRTLNADLTAFYIRYKNPIINQATSGIPLAYNDNVSAAISQGLEASLLWNTPVPGLRLTATAALTDAHITEPFTATGNVQIEPGQQMPGTAPQQYGVFINYLRPFGFIDVNLNTGYNYVGQGYNNLQHDLKINGYGTFDAGLVFSSDALDYHPKLAINVSNLLNEAKASSAQTGTPIVPTGPLTLYGLIPPRTLTARISFDF